MQIDLLHNKIVKDTLSPEFEQSVREVLVPIVREAYPEADGILMYEDYLADGFAEGGKWFYPLTVKCGGASSTLWVCWPYAEDSSDYALRSPYSYVGEEPLAFEAAALVPERFSAALDGRAIDYDGGAMRANVRAAVEDPLILVGRYSQTFVDEMARQLTSEISRVMTIDGLGSSTIELEMVFAPGTYMEHTSENVTYRRLLLVDGASKPRDFWVKWTHIGGEDAFTVSDHVLDSNILFEIGEDAPHKIREKEYRFLCASNPTTYQAAMGKKSVTEWRDLIKRAIRRGEINRLESELVLAERAAEVHDAMAELLGSLGYSAPVAEPAPVEEKDSFDSLMSMARAALEKSESHAHDSLSVSEEASEVEVPDELDLPWLELGEDEIKSDEAELEESVDAEETDEVEEAEAEEAEAEEAEAEEAEDEPVAEEVVEDEHVAEPATEQTAKKSFNESEFGAPFTIDELLARVEMAEREDALAKEAESEIAAEEIVADEPAEADGYSDEPVADAAEDCELEEVVEATEVTVAPAVDEESIRREIEAKLRLEYEAEARARAEAELEKLLAESRALREENERLAKAAREARELHMQAISDGIDERERARAVEDQLRRELEAKERQEARERDRLAEAARLAVEEQRRLEAERLEREEAERREAERRAEEERYLREAEEAERKLAEEKAEAARLKAEQERAAAEQFMTKRARIIFRSATDPNVISRIREIIEDTIRRENKQHVRIHMKAYQEERDTVILDILKMPRSEQELLVAMVKAIGNARIGVVKIILE